MYIHTWGPKRTIIHKVVHNFNKFRRVTFGKQYCYTSVENRPSVRKQVAYCITDGSCQQLQQRSLATVVTAFMISSAGLIID